MSDSKNKKEESDKKDESKDKNDKKDESKNKSDTKVIWSCHFYEGDRYVTSRLYETKEEAEKQRDVLLERDANNYLKRWNKNQHISIWGCPDIKNMLRYTPNALIKDDRRDYISLTCSGFLLIVDYLKTLELKNPIIWYHVEGCFELPNLPIDIIEKLCRCHIKNVIPPSDVLTEIIKRDRPQAIVKQLTLTKEILTLEEIDELYYENG